jgi:hypothetical protein
LGDLVAFGSEYWNLAIQGRRLFLSGQQTEIESSESHTRGEKKTQLLCVL